MVARVFLKTALSLETFIFNQQEVQSSSAFSSKWFSFSPYKQDLHNNNHKQYKDT